MSIPKTRHLAKSINVAITNDKGRLSKNDIWRIIALNERYKQQDEAAFNLKNTLNDEKIRDKVSAEDRSTIEGEVQEVNKWLEKNHDATTEQ